MIFGLRPGFDRTPANILVGDAHILPHFIKLPTVSLKAETLPTESTKPHRHPLGMVQRAFEARDGLDPHSLPVSPRLPRSTLAPASSDADLDGLSAAEMP